MPGYLTTGFDGCAMELGHRDRVVVGGVFVAVAVYAGWVAYQLLAALV